MCDAVAYWIHFYGIGAAIAVIIIGTSVYIAFYTVVVGMHFVGRNVIACCIIMH